MENICRYAEILNVDELCEVTMSTIFVGAHAYLEAAMAEDPKENFSIMNMMSREGLELDSLYPNCLCQTCAEPIDADFYSSVGISDEFHDKNEAYVNFVTKAGAVRATTCAPYLTGWIPMRGQHFVTTESSNVILCNSLFGACANPEGIESSFWASICGRIPKYGKHDPANRTGTCLVEVKCEIETTEDWDLLGYVMGKGLPKASVPVLTGPFVNPNIYKFKQFCASLAIVSDIDLCHIVGLTPEAVTEEMAFGGKEPSGVYEIGREDLDAARRDLCSQKPGPVDFINMGCPHYSIFEIQQAADYLRGKKVAEGVTLNIWTTYSVRALADRCGFTQTIRDAGGELYAGACPYYLFDHEKTRDLLLGKRRGAAFDSIKMAYGMPNYYEPELQTYFGSMEECLRAAVTGIWG